MRVIYYLKYTSSYNHLLSGKIKENATHTIKDTLKILECGVSSLRKEAAHLNSASLSTSMKLKVYDIHVINHKLLY